MNNAPGNKTPDSPAPDSMAMAARMITLAEAAGLTLVTAESCTGGLLAATITDVPGSSVVMDRGFVTYSNAAKQALLGVRAETLERVGAVSEEVAAEMAEGAREAAHAGLGLAVTGIAGPGGSDCKPEGRVCFGLAREGHPTVVETVEFGPQGRANVRAAAVLHGLSMVCAALES